MRNFKKHLGKMVVIAIPPLCNLLCCLLLWRAGWRVCFRDGLFSAALVVLTGMSFILACLNFAIWKEKEVIEE